MVLYRRSTGPVFWELKACSGEWHSTLPHCHAEWSLGLVEAGACEVGCDGQRIRVQAPALVWFSPNTVHECRPVRTEEWGFHMVYWRAPGPPRTWGTTPLGPQEVPGWRRFFQTLSEGGAPDPTEVPGWIQTLGFGRPHPGRPIPGPGPILRGSRPDRTYKRIHGLAPTRHRTVLRLLEAQELLRQGTPPAQAALQTGFYDQSQFTRAFRALTGTTPGRFLHPGP